MKKMLTVWSILILCAILYGCGGGVSGSGSSGNSVQKSQSCLVSGCHATFVSRITGKNIADEWKSSIHYRMNVAGCADCHEGEHNSGNKCGDCHGSSIPASSGVAEACGRCHGLNHPEDRMISRSPQHFGAMSSHMTRFTNKDRASYISSQYDGKCRKCHNPHDPSTSFDYTRVWAESAHGNTLASARTSRDFKMVGTYRPANLAYANSSPPTSSGNSNTYQGIEYSPICARCHTTTGYINFVESAGFLNVSPFGNVLGGAYTDTTKEVTGCDACHMSYSYQRRTVKPVTIYFNFSATTTGTVKLNNNPVSFPDLGYSNMCIPCHSGRGVGSALKQLADMGLDFANTAALPSGHEFSGAGLLTAKTGYEFPFKNYTTGKGSVTHHDDNSTATGSGIPRGPCISCHMDTSVPSQSHLFLPVEHGAAFSTFTSSSLAWSGVYSVKSGAPASLTVSEILSRSCSVYGCHAGSGTKSMAVADLNTYKQGFIASLAVLDRWVKLLRNVPVDPSLPWNATTNPLRPSTKWDYLGSGLNTMGAVFNNSLVGADPGAFVHRPLYAKRLVYDSISWLMQNKSQTNVADAIQWLVLNDSTSATLDSKTGLPTYSTPRIPQGVADAAIKWLYGKDRTNLTASDKLKRPGD